MYQQVEHVFHPEFFLEDTSFSFLTAWKVLGTPNSDDHHLSRVKYANGPMVFRKKKKKQSYGGFHKWWVPENEWFLMENPIKMDDN